MARRRPVLGRGSGTVASLGGRFAVGRRLLLLGMAAVGFYVVVGLIVVAVGWTSMSQVRNGQLQLDLAVGALFLIWVVVSGLFGRAHQSPPTAGVVLEAARHPRLHHVTSIVAEQLGVTDQIHLRLIDGYNASVTQVGLPRRVRHGVVLKIGFGLLHVLTIDQVRAVLAHELAHVHAGDHRHTRFAGHLEAMFVRAACTLHRSWLASVFHAVASPFRRFMAIIHRHQEARADGLALLVVDGEDLARADRHLVHAELLDQLHASHDPTWHERPVAQRHEQVARVLRGGGHAAAMDLLADRLEVVGEPAAGHRPTRRRVVPEVSVGGRTRDRSAGHTLLGPLDPDELQAMTPARGLAACSCQSSPMP